MQHETEAAAADPTQALADFAAGLHFDAIPARVIRRTEDLFLDWFASALAGKGARPVESIARFIEAMGPESGPSEILIHRRGSSPLVAAITNAAASHFAEQDDVHNGSVFHPATVVFPPALAVAQALGKSGRELLTACVAGYEVGIRVGEFLGRSHYKTFHTTGTAGTFAAAVAVGHLLGLDAAQMRHAFGSAGTQSAGLWEFLRDAADSKQLHTAHAAGAGLTAAYLAKDGFTGAKRILDGRQGLAAGMSTDADARKLVDGLARERRAAPSSLDPLGGRAPYGGDLGVSSTRWTLAETSFKFHAACRHTHPAADALLQVLTTHHLTATDLHSVTALVHQAAIDVLGPVTDPQTVHQAKFSMGTVLGLVAVFGNAGLNAFDDSHRDAAVRAVHDRVTMRLDDEVDRAYPARWIGKVIVETGDGRRFEGKVLEPKGDPGNTLSRTEIEAKALQLAAYRDGATRDEMRRVIERVWSLADAPVVTTFLV